VTTAQVRELSEKWFGPIPSGKKTDRKLPAEPAQKEKRILQVEAKVPAHAFYKAYHMTGRFHSDYYSDDLLSDILSRGQSSRLYNKLVKEKEIFASISSFVTGSIDPGLFVVSGRLREGITLAQAEKEVDAVLNEVVKNGAGEDELVKVKNQAFAALEFGEVEVMNRAMNLAFAKLSGNTNLVNDEGKMIDAVTLKDIQRIAAEVIREENSSVLYYQAVN
jgi:zinc protease